MRESIDLYRNFCFDYPPLCLGQTVAKCPTILNQNKFRQGFQPLIVNVQLPQVRDGVDHII